MIPLSEKWVYFYYFCGTYIIRLCETHVVELVFSPIIIVLNVILVNTATGLLCTKLFSSGKTILSLFLKPENGNLRDVKKIAKAKANDKSRDQICIGLTPKPKNGGPCN